MAVRSHASCGFTSGSIRWTGSFTEKGCIPVRTLTVLPDGAVQSELVLDVVLGISDPDVFVVDAELCPIPPVALN